MRSKSLVVGQDAMKLLLELESSGALDEVSLTLTDSNMKYETWEAMGRFFGSIDRRVLWYIGDWLIFGEAVFGEAASQGIEATTAERYSEAERVTGLAHGTLMNVRSICASIARSRRKKELGFWVHAPVTKLEPKDQARWLDKAIRKGWTRSQLALAIKGGNPDADVGFESDPLDGSDGSGSHISVGERIEIAARQVLTAAQPVGDGSYTVPSEPITRLREAFGEGT